MCKNGVKSLQNPQPLSDGATQSAILNLQKEGASNLPVEEVFPGSPLSTGPDTKFGFRQGEPVPREKEMNVTCYLMMMDVLIKQV